MTNINKTTYILQYISNNNLENIFTNTFNREQVVEFYNAIKDSLIHKHIRDMHFSSIQTLGQVLVNGVKIETPLSPESAFVQQCSEAGAVPNFKFVEDICLSVICSCLFDINEMPSNIKLSYSDNALQKNIVTITISDDETWADYTEKQYLKNIEADLLKTDNDLDTLMEEVVEEMRLDDLVHEKEKQAYIEALSSKNPSRHGPLEAYV